jgi:hypothetical protein
MEEEGVPSTALREVSLLQMLSESIFVVRCAPGAGRRARSLRRALESTALGAHARGVAPRARRAPQPRAKQRSRRHWMACRRRTRRSAAARRR